MIAVDKTTHYTDFQLIRRSFDMRLKIGISTALSLIFATTAAFGQVTIKEPESDIIYDFKGNAYEDFENGSSYGSQGLNYYPLYTPGSGEKSSEEGFAEFEKNKYKRSPNPNEYHDGSEYYGIVD